MPAAFWFAIGAIFTANAVIAVALGAGMGSFVALCAVTSFAACLTGCLAVHRSGHATTGRLRRP